MSAIKLSTPSSGSISLSPANTASNLTITVPAVTDTMTTTTTKIVSGTAVASTSGTSIDFTGIPSWVKKITVMLASVSTNGSSNPFLRVGTSSGFVATGYEATGAFAGATSGGTIYTTGFGWGAISASNILHGSITLTLVNSASNLWVASGVVVQTNSAFSYQIAGSITLSGVLDRVRITTANGTDAFDAGTINILYE